MTRTITPQPPSSPSPSPRAVPPEQPQPRRLPVTSHPAWPCPAARACCRQGWLAAGAPGWRGSGARWRGEKSAFKIPICQYDITIEAMEVSPDHVSILCSFPPPSSSIVPWRWHSGWTARALVYKVFLCDCRWW